jgi:hypothetical protein
MRVKGPFICNLKNKSERQIADHYTRMDKTGSVDPDPKRGGGENISVDRIIR